MRRTTGLLTFVCALIALRSFAQAPNGSFDHGLLEWKAAWHLAVQDGEAVLADVQANHAFLFQAVPIEPDAFTLEIDFLPALSINVPAGAFRDTAFASLYFVDDPAQLILENDRFSAAQGLFDLDAGGVFNLQGNVAPSPKGAGWSRFTTTLSSTHRFVAIVFELYDLNLVAGDSSLRIDNVRLTQESPE